MVSGRRNWRALNFSVVSRVVLKCHKGGKGAFKFLKQNNWASKTIQEEGVDGSWKVECPEPRGPDQFLKTISLGGWSEHSRSAENNPLRVVLLLTLLSYSDQSPRALQLQHAWAFSSISYYMYRNPPNNSIQSETPIYFVVLASQNFLNCDWLTSTGIVFLSNRRASTFWNQARAM